ncbi:uncharacterized protein TM35_000231990 [Trypanosoma theileri]|uniref:Uncharacterized protein n=1 Tax=Trypanosoma theileri TaxID=67003 RepID=A0A1X0NRQ4_9TRYP|nr:uncharacterized protein TM35_000231990 [Trypanosoma theileri]ORC87228.1 hypothetical protein TM35_000231990 [Trypanosoma theileri]
MSRRTEREREEERRHLVSTWPLQPLDPPTEIPTSHSVSSSIGISGLEGTSPQSPHQLPSLSKTPPATTVDTNTFHTKETPVTVTLPHLYRGNSDKVQSPLLEIKAKTQRREIPSYNVRTVVRRENHPLWSPSIKVQLQYLFGNNISHIHSSPSEKHKADKRLLESSEDPRLHTFEAAKCSQSTIDRMPPKMVKDSNHIKRIIPTKIAVKALESDAAHQKEELDENEPLPKEEEEEEENQKKEKWVYLGPREFATLFSLLLRDECVARQAIVEEERYEAISTLPLPPCASPETLHPALVTGCKEISLTEEILRRELLTEEASEIAPLWDLFIYEHRCFVMGTAPLKKYLQKWLWLYRGRKMRQHARLERLFTQEFTSRNEITMEYWESQQQLFTALTTVMEQLYRTAVERLQICTQYAHGVAYIHMQEHLERFPLLYGAVMSKTFVCGRISGLTLFKQLDLLEQHDRWQIMRIEEGERIGVSCTMLREELVDFTEIEDRLLIVNEEATACMQLRFRLLAARERCHRREWEIVEACERELDLEPAIKAIVASNEEEEPWN